MQRGVVQASTKIEGPTHHVARSDGEVAGWKSWGSSSKNGHGLGSDTIIQAL